MKLRALETVEFDITRWEPQPAWQEPFQRVLVPADPLGREAEAFAYDEYDDGVLVRSRPDVTGPFRLDAALQDSLGAAGELWRNERVGGEPVRASQEMVRMLAPSPYVVVTADDVEERKLACRMGECGGSESSS